jgi:phage tail sheath gpL-like
MSSPNVTFTQIPANVRKPGVYLEENTTNALKGLAPLGGKTVLLAQQLSTGAVAVNSPTKIFGEADAILDFGGGSVAHIAAKAAFKANPYLDLSVVGITDGTTAATAGLGVTGGAAAVAGSLAVWIGDSRIDVTIPQGWTAAQGATGICGAIYAQQSNLPVTATVSGNNVTLTCKNRGTLGNQIPLSLAIQSGLTGMQFVTGDFTGGATDPVLGDYATPGTVLASIASAGYDVIINTLNDATNLASLKSMVDFCSNSMEQRPCVAALGLTDQNDTLTNLETLVGNVNSGRFSAAYISYASGNLAKSIPWQVGAAYGALIAGMSDPASPMNGLVLTGITPPAVIDRLTRLTQESMLNAGLAPLEVIPGELVSIVRSITTYTTNSAGIADPTLLDLQTLRSLDYVRAAERQRLVLRFPRSKLNQRTIDAVKHEVIDVLYLLQQLEIVQNVNYYESAVIVERDLTDVTRLNIKVPSNVVPGLMTICGVIDLILG